MPPCPSAVSNPEPEDQTDNSPAAIVRPGCWGEEVQATQKQGDVDMAPDGVGIAASEEVYRDW